jgi:hypothetical protein
VSPFWAAFLDEVKLAYTLKSTIPESLKFESVPGKNVVDSMRPIPPSRRLAPAINKRHVNAEGSSIDPQQPR